MNKSTRPTVRDVAREAGVSIATVSRTLTRPEDVKAKTREHVFSVIKRLGYRANSAASDLKRGTSRTLLVLVSDITNAFFAEFFKGIEEEARASGYVVLIGDTSEDAGAERAYSDMLLLNQAGGLILNTYGIPEDLIPDGAGTQYAGPPLVSCAGHKDFAFPSVRIDDVLGGRLAAEHLIAMGHKNIVQVCGPLQVHGFERRYFGFTQSLKSAGIANPPGNTLSGELSIAFGQQVAKEIAARVDRPTAVFVHNDETAIGLMHGLSQAGLRVPDDISIVGYDDMPYSAVFSPPITTLHLPKRHWGRLACRRLIEILNSDDEVTFEDIIIAPKLMDRASTKRVRADARVER